MDEFEEIESGDAFRWPKANSAERSRKVDAVLEQVQFPQAVRGYDRVAVDRYVDDVRALVAELEASSSPDAAVQRAIEEISDETRDVLLRAQQSAQEITTRARDRAEALLERTERETSEARATTERETSEARATTEREVSDLRATARHEVEQLWNTAQHEVSELRANAQREVEELRATAQREVEDLWATAQREASELRATARRETDELIAAAESRVRELNDSADRLLAERRRLLENMESVSSQLSSIASAEAGRFVEPGEPQAATASTGAGPAASTEQL